MYMSRVLPLIVWRLTQLCLSVCLFVCVSVCLSVLHRFVDEAHKNGGDMHRKRLKHDGPGRIRYELSSLLGRK
eukprot:COSAG05_NODE_323_length_11408_cov_361.826156_4_plen_73_part_00